MSGPKGTAPRRTGHAPRTAPGSAARAHGTAPGAVPAAEGYHDVIDAAGLAAANGRKFAPEKISKFGNDPRDVSRADGIERYRLPLAIRGLVLDASMRRDERLSSSGNQGRTRRQVAPAISTCTGPDFLGKDNSAARPSG